MKIARLTRRELNKFNSCIDMALEEFEGKKDEVKSILETSGSYDFFPNIYVGSKRYRIVVKADLNSHYESLRFVQLTVSSENIDLAKVERNGEVAATHEKAELTEGDDLYFIEYEIRDSHLVFYALKTIDGDTYLSAEFKTKQPFSKGIAGLHAAIISHYKALKNSSALCAGG